MIKNPINLTIIEGEILRDAELISAGKGNSICKFDLAVSDFYKTDDGYDTTTHFIPVRISGYYGESLYTSLKKGKAIRVTGSIKHSSYIDDFGKERSTLYVNASMVDFIKFREGD